MYYSAVCPSPLGMLTLGSDGEHLIGLWLEGQKYFGGAVREVLESLDLMIDSHPEYREAALLERFVEPPAFPKGDGLATDKPGIGLLIKTADCQPVLVAHKEGRHIAAFHIGWRGNRLRFLQSGIAAFCGRYGLDARDLLAVRGPSLGPQRSEFVNYDEEWGPDFANWFNARDKTMNLWRLTRDQLLEAGLPDEGIFGLDLCTASMPDSFFSYRRDGICGRQANVIWTV